MSSYSSYYCPNSASAPSSYPSNPDLLFNYTSQPQTYTSNSSSNSHNHGCVPSVVISQPGGLLRPSSLHQTNNASYNGHGHHHRHYAGGFGNSFGFNEKFRSSYGSDRNLASTFETQVAFLAETMGG